MLLGGVYVGDVRFSLPASTTKYYVWRGWSAIRQVVIHHTAGANRDFTAREVAEYHVVDRGWPGIGYHFLVHPDGRIEYVGNLRTVRYHCGRHNAASIGICLAGDFTTAYPAGGQLMRARMLVNGLWREVGREMPVFGHCELVNTGYGPTECPGRTWPRWRERVIPALWTAPVT